MAHRLSPTEFAGMYEAHAPSLWCIAAAILGDRSLAEDVVQEAAIVGLRKLADFERGSCFRAWMGQIVRNVARNHGRRRARGPMLTGDERVLDGPPRSGPSAAAGGAPLTSRGALREDQAHFDDDVLAALRGLGEQARTCLLLRTVLDLPYHEISRLLDIPEGTAMSHVYRSRREMRRRLASSGSARQPDRA